MDARRRLFSAAAVSSLLTAGCGTEKHFDLHWDEEVKLHDGAVVVVGLKHFYERLDWSFARNGGTALARDTALTLNPGGPGGPITQLFKGFHPMFLDRFEGEWFSVLYGSYYGHSRELPGQDWGTLEGPYGQWAVKLLQNKWVPISMGNLPSIFQEPNMLMLYGTAEEHAAFDGKRVSLEDKRTWLRKHPPGYADVRLTRPIAASSRRADSPFPPSSQKQ
jgi:hypothetical protein